MKSRQSIDSTLIGREEGLIAFQLAGDVCTVLPTLSGTAIKAYLHILRVHYVVIYIGQISIYHTLHNYFLLGMYYTGTCVLANTVYGCCSMHY